MARTRKVTNLQRTGGVLRRHTSGSFSVSTVWRDVQEDARIYDEPLGKRSETWIIETIHLMEYHGLLELRDSGKLRMMPKLREIVKEAQKRVEELQFDSEQDELDFLRKRVLKRIGRLPPVRKRELHREHMTLQKQVRDGTVNHGHKQRADKSTSTSSVARVEASTGVSHDAEVFCEHHVPSASFSTPVRRPQGADSRQRVQQAYPTPTSSSRGTSSRHIPVVPPTPESPTPTSRTASWNEPVFNMDENYADEDTSAGPGTEDVLAISSSAIPTCALLGDAGVQERLEQKDTEIAALKTECAKLSSLLRDAITDRDAWKAKRDELKHGLCAEQRYVQYVESELAARERKKAELEGALRRYEDQLDMIIGVASVRRPVQESVDDRSVNDNVITHAQAGPITVRGLQQCLVM